MSELDRRIELTPNRFVALFFRITRNVDIVKSHNDVKVSALHINLVLNIFNSFLFNYRIFHCAIYKARREVC